MKDPAFSFYSDNFLGGTALMTDEQVGKYIRLLCIQHLNGHITTEQLERLSGGHAEIKKKFIQDTEGLWYNDRLQREVDKKEVWSKAQTAKINKRWHKNTGVDTGVDTGVLPSVPVPVPVPDSSSGGNGIPPIFEDVEKYCKERGKGVNPQKWYDHYSAKGWKIGTGKMVDWKAAVRTWEKDTPQGPQREYTSAEEQHAAAAKARQERETKATRELLKNNPEER